MSPPAHRRTGSSPGTCGAATPRVYDEDASRPDRLVFSPDGSTLVALRGGRQVSRTRPGDGPEASDRLARSGAGPGRSTSRSPPTEAGWPSAATGIPAVRSRRRSGGSRRARRRRSSPGAALSSTWPSPATARASSSAATTMCRSGGCNRSASSTPSSTIGQEVWAVAISPDGADRGVGRERRRPADLGPGHRPSSASRR